jgi:hypothetical protein
MDNMQMGRHKVLLFAHSRSASVHCSEAPAIPNVLLGITQPKHWETMFWVVGWGAILMAVSNSFNVSFRLIRTREKAGKIKLSLSPILD